MDSHEELESLRRSAQWFQTRPRPHVNPARRKALDHAVSLYLDKKLSLKEAADEADVGVEALTRELGDRIRPRYQRKLSKEEVAIVRRSRRTTRELAEQFRVSPRTIGRARKGTPKRPRGRPRKSRARSKRQASPDPETQAMWAAYEGGRSCAEVAAAFGLSASGVSRRLRAAGYNLRRAGRPAGEAREC